jgi:hypothetical protein
MDPALQPGREDTSQYLSLGLEAIRPFRVVGNDDDPLADTRRVTAVRSWNACGRAAG